MEMWIYGCFLRIRRHGSCRGIWDIYGCWDMYPETWILQRIHISGYQHMTWTHGSRNMDIADILKQKILKHQWASCKGSWAILSDAEIWDMSPKSWIVQKIHNGGCQDMNRCHGTGDMDLRNESGDTDLAEDPEIYMNAETWIGHMDFAEDPEIRKCRDMNPK